MGSLKVPALVANVTDNPLTAIRPAGRLTHDPLTGALAIHDGVTPGGERFNRHKSRGIGAVELPIATVLAALPYTPEMYGAVGDGVADDAPAIRRAIAAAKQFSNTNRMGKVSLTPNKRYKCNSSVIVPVDQVQFDGSGCTMDFSALPLDNNYAVLLTGELYPPWFQPGRSFGNVHLTGPITNATLPAKNHSGVGLLIRSDADGGPSHLIIPGIQIESFGVGIQIGARAYIISFYDADVWANGVCVDMLNEADCGENIRFFGGVLYNSDLAIRMSNPNAEINFFGTSIDYNGQMAVTTGGRLTFSGCHFESKNDVVAGKRQFVISGNGGGVQIEGGIRVMTARPIDMDYWVDCTAPGFYYENNIFAISDRTSTNAFATGTGSIQRGRLNGYETYENCQKLHATRSALIDPSFANAALPDNLFVAPTAGNFVVQTRTQEDHTSVGPTTTLVTDAGRLKFTKGGGGGFGSLFWLLVPVNADDLAVAFLDYTKPGAGAGTIYVTASYVRLNPTHPLSVKVPEVVTLLSPGTVQIDFTSAAVTAPVTIGFAGLTTIRAPRGATHFGLQFNAINMGIGDVFFSNPNMGAIM